MDATLASFQDAFTVALGAQGARYDGQHAALVAQPGFAVYCNTVQKANIEALRANYPAVARLVGEEWFCAAAAAYAHARPPQVPMLGEYGSDFAAFLAAFAPAQELPYLPDVARLDRLWWEAHAAADEESLTRPALAGLTQAELAQVRLVPSAAARWRWFADMPIYSIWSRNRAKAEPDEYLDWQAEGALIVRDGGGTVRWTALGQGGCELLNACARGFPAAEAAEATIAAEPSIDFSRLVATLVDFGAFALLELGPRPATERNLP